ncbi:uncharacterized protein [Physcomitrium patens]|uniref:uncharacterized protein isoform X2 n=1 Tax=Physcomitrium patens TaxID=3218 RepID=UPI000D17A3D9|nr:cilia- and flagella-associated protein 58-like isoform X2 [Physcomitrium patens]|eukprot:XP_024400258.1 cilia- and flagella-associated protein 58-like isoform X2 [Physcomitrella patens]
MAEIEKEPIDAPPQPTLESWIFDSLERDFQEVLTELEGDRSFDRFREEYEKIHRALRKSHESEKRLVKKCRELNGEIQKNAKKVTSSLKLNEEDAKTISKLKVELDKAWQMVVESQDKEAKAKEHIQALKKQLADLGDDVVDRGAAASARPNSEVLEPDEEKEKTMRQIEALKGYIETLKKEIDGLQEKTTLAKTRVSELEYELGSTKELLASKTSEYERELKKKERIAKQLKTHIAELTFKDNEIKNQISLYDSSRLQGVHLSDALKEAKVVAEKATKDLQLLNLRMEKLNAEMEEQISANTQLLADNSQKQVELKLKEEDIENLKEELVSVNKLQDVALNKIKSMEYAHEDLDNKLRSLVDQKNKIERDLDNQTKVVEQQKRRIEEIVREKDIIKKLKTQADEETIKQMSLVKVEHIALKNIECELNLYKTASIKQNANIKALEDQKQKVAIELAAELSNYKHAQELIQDRESQILDFHKKIEELNISLKQQQNNNEAIRSERNIYSKNLVSAQDEIKEMKRKFKVMNHLVEQLKEGLNSKDAAIIKERFELLKVEKEREVLKREISKVMIRAQAAEASIVEQLSEIRQLNQTLTQNQSNIISIQKDLEAYKNDRDTLGIQLVKKNQEIKLIYEKMKIQTLTLSKGQAQYKDRVQEIQILKIKITNLKRDQIIFSRSVKNMSVLKKNIFNLSKELNAEKTKVRALSEELENPLNVHRWRKLEGSDPQAYEMIMKIQTLQKRLILKSEEVVEKDLLIQDKEKLYAELCGVLAKQPGPEIFDQIVSYARSLNQKSQQIKAMASELNMFQVHIAKYKLEVERSHNEIDSLKKQLHTSKQQRESTNNIKDKR